MARVTKRGSGVAEHTFAKDWQASLAFSNLGLPGKAFTGNQWKEHKKTNLLGGIQARGLGRINLLIETFLGPDYRSASAVPLAPLHTALGMAQNGAFDAQAQILAHNPQHPIHDPNVKAEDDALKHEIDFGEVSGEDNGSEELSDEIEAIGFALVQSVSMLPGLAHSDCTGIDIIQGICTKDDLQALEEIKQRFFTKRSVQQSTPPRADSKAARVIKTRDEIATAWKVILERRHLVEWDDTRPITNPKTRAAMYTSWMHDWCSENLTDNQRGQKGNKQSSIFAAYLHNNFGNKHFVMALWETGVQWAPPPQMLKDDYSGAIEHVAKNFAK